MLVAFADQIGDSVLAMEEYADDEPGKAELRPLLREALAALREMQQDESVRPKLEEFAEGKISAAELKQWLGAMR